MKRILILAVFAITLLLSCKKDAQQEDTPIVESTFLIQEGDTICHVIDLKNTVKSDESSFLGDPCIFIDHDGIYLPINSPWHAGLPLYCQPSGMDISRLNYLRQMVEDDFYPLNVDVTFDSAVYAAAPINRRARIGLTTSTEVDPVMTAGGVAILESFTDNYVVSAWVFTNRLGYSVELVARTVSHEAGHVLGLRHASLWSGCTLIAEYRPSQGVNDIVGSAAIMGYNYDCKISNWFIGTNQLSCTNIVNELQDMATLTGWRADEASSDFSAPKTLWFSNKIPNTPRFGCLTQNDRDVWQTPATIGYIVSITSVLPDNFYAPYYGNIDIKAEVYNQAQQLVSTYDPANEVDVFNVTVPQGHYLKIMGTSANTYFATQNMTGKYFIRMEQIVF